MEHTFDFQPRLKWLVLNDIARYTISEHLYSQTRQRVKEAILEACRVRVGVQAEGAVA